MYSTSPRPAAVIPGVPTFIPAELHKQLDAVLGKGASGTVYSLRDFPGLAVKEILLDSLDQRSIDAAKLELATLTTLTHPGILRYHQVIEDDSFIYIVMDRHDGTLEHLIVEHDQIKTPISFELIITLTAQIVSALAYLHSIYGVDANGDPYQGVVHRNFNPANVLVSKNGGRAVLADFGLCRSTMASGSTRAGSPAYMAPETLLYNSTIPASNVWALGVIIYELATLKRPNFLGDKEPNHVFTSGWRPDLNAVEDDSIKSILERIFVLDPAKRPLAKELASLLQKSNISGNRQQAYGTSLEDRCMFLEAILKDANARIAALEGQCKEHLATTKALESRIAFLTTNNLQSELLLLPRLMRAAHTNSTETVRMLVESGDGIGKRDEQGMTALMHTAQQGNIEPARLLVEKEKGLQDRDGWTALMHAVHNNHPGVVEILAAHECGKRDSNGRTALMIAAERGRTEIVAALAPHEKGLTDSSGNTALMLAASNAHIEAVRQLVEHEKGARDSRGRTALVLAARAGHREIAELLMEHEKDVTGWTMLMCAAYLGDISMIFQNLGEKGQRDKLGQTALILAAQIKRNDAVKLLIAYECSISGWTSLICAAYLGDIDAVRNNLHENGYKDITGMTALMWAAYQGHKEAVEVLIEQEKGMRDRQGYNALYWALRNRHTAAAEIIIPHEDPTDENGVTALMRAAARGDAEMVELLAPLQKGAKNKEENTAFVHALKNRHEDVAMLLYRYEALSWTPLMCAAAAGDIKAAKKYFSEKDRKNDDGDTAFMIAAKAGQESIVELFDPTDRNGVTALMRAVDRKDIRTIELLISLQKGRRTTKIVWIRRLLISKGTALIRAAARGYIEVVKLLMEYEGGMQDTDGRTALMWAARNGHLECVELLLEKEINMQNSKGWTALMFAVYWKEPECTRFLVERERDIKTTHTWHGFPPDTAAIDIAKKCGHKEIIAIFLD
ncbi:CH-TOG protein [Giardia duodenalis]|uniref:CH-TOG protein n=1 Tax=Giardia intestinalis TaxID=5741 RepID=V6TMW8_GIAIN|nr:CH-TOG protein [Giardia intestinalis]